MNVLNITKSMELIVYNYVRCFEQVRGQNFELVHSRGDGIYDIVVRLNEDEELVIGEVDVDTDFNVYVEFFDDNEVLDD